MADMGRLSTQYQRATSAATVIDRAVEELRTEPRGQVSEHGNAIGRYLATVAGLIDPAYAREIDPEFANTVPSTLITTMGYKADQDPEFSGELLATAKAIGAETPLKAEQIELVDEVAEAATAGAVQLSNQILAP